MSDTKNAIIIGASSGIGAALARILSKNGYHVGLAARREEELNKIAEDLEGKRRVMVVDVADAETAMLRLKKLIETFGDVAVFVISAGVGFENRKLDWQPERETIAINVQGFAAMAHVACEHLELRGKGHLVGISSIAAIRGHGDAPAYGASKAFITNYLQGLRHRFVQRKLPIHVLDVQPGFVDTAMAKAEQLFWVAPPEKAATQIFRAIQKNKSHVYVTKRWRLVAWALKCLPKVLYHRL